MTQAVISPNMCMALAIFSLIVGVVEPNSGVIGQYLVGCYCVYRCRLEYVPVLFVCHINSRDFEVVSSYVEGIKLNTFSSLRTTDLVLPTFGEISAVLLCAYIFIVFCFSRITLGDSKLRIIFLVWVFCVAGGLINSVFSLSEGHYLWSRGLRAVLTVGCCFYGILLAQRSRITDDMSLVGNSLWLVFIPGLLITLHLFWSHMVFWLVSIASILLFVNLKVKNAFLYRLSAIAYLPVSVGSTLTLMLISFGSFIAAALFMSKTKFFRSIVTKTIIFLIIIGPFISLGVGAFSDSFTFSNNISLIDNDNSASINDRVTYKFAADRMPLWSEAYKQIIEGDFLFPTSGRVIDLIYFGQEVEWEYGAHNTYLEILRNNGLFFGAFLIFIISFLLIKITKSQVKNSTGYRLFAVSLSSMAIVSMLFGDFIVDVTIGPLFWTSTGILIWRFHQLKSSVVQKNLVMGQ